MSPFDLAIRVLYALKKRGIRHRQYADHVSWKLKGRNCHLGFTLSEVAIVYDDLRLSIDTTEEPKRAERVIERVIEDIRNDKC